MMKRIYQYIILLVTVILTGCAANDELKSNSQKLADACELQGVEASIAGGDHRVTRGTVTDLADYVGRDVFVGNDKIVFTKICRTVYPLSDFTYPTSSDYDGIAFSKASAESGWARVTSDGGPERVYWTDATNDHTFVGYSIPQDYYHDENSKVEYDWKKCTISNQVCYIGSLGDPTKTGESDIIDYTLTAEEQNANKITVEEVTTYSNPKLESEDLLLAYDKGLKADGGVADVKFYHGLSNVRVVVNISGFSSTTADYAAKVSDLYILEQPTMYIWMQSSSGAQELRNFSSGETTPQGIIDAAYGTSGTPAYNQTKNLKLWIPEPNGTGENQSKTFTFYGITTPQTSTTAKIQFKVTYPDPMNPTEKTIQNTYTAEMSGVEFRAGYNTTINVALNHKDEKITIGAQYQNWQFIATPDAGALKKNSTFLADTQRANVTIVGDEKANIDDATWLYEAEITEGSTTVKKIYDIYGNDGSTEEKAYKICTAYQLLSLAYEVTQGNNKVGRDFSGKFIRLDADITLQTSSTKTYEEMQKLETSASELAKYSHALDWIGIGTTDKPFKGTFIGGDRYIYRLHGKPLFNTIGEGAKIQHLQMTVINIEDGTGAIANSNAGLICGSSIVSDVALTGTSATPAGAFVGTNTGTIFCSYHIGDTKSSASSAVVGGLVGSNSGIIASCYHAGAVTGTTVGGITGSNADSGTTLDNNYYNKTLLSGITDIYGVTGKSTAEMTKQAFVTEINTGISTWRQNHSGYDDHQYQYNAANYPTLQETLKSKN